MEKGWFIIDGVQEGDRYVTEQLTGLGMLEDNAKGCSVLDFGCAEGLISRHLVQTCGASGAVGLSLVGREIEQGRRQCDGLPIALHQVNLDEFRGWLDAFPNELQPADIVLLLSILHKLKHPLRFLDLALRYARNMVAIRLPGPVIIDARSDRVPYNVKQHMRNRGFILADKPKGPRGEWLTIWQRRR